MKSITCILSGVGVSGYSALALMEFFHQQHRKPDLLIGCSTGALISALWASEYHPTQALKIVLDVFEVSLSKKVDFLTALTFFKSAHGQYKEDHALLNPEKLKAIYKEIFKDQKIEDLPIRCIFQTTEVQTGETYFLKKGLVCDAVYAASAMLPFYPPIRINNRLLTDGVFTEALPLRAVLDENPEVIIALDVQARDDKKHKNLMSYYTNFMHNALRLSSAYRTALVYDLHNDEILIIPIKIMVSDSDSQEGLKKAINAAREVILAKKENLVELIG